MGTKAVLYIVIPCYNEEKVLPITSGIFLEKMQKLIQDEKIDEKSRIMFVNDGSKDRTWEIILELAKKDEHFIGISQSRNRGHQNAVLAGLMEVKDCCDITISIDCDGQDDINAMDQMIEEYYDGCEIVYGIAWKNSCRMGKYGMYCCFYRRSTVDLHRGDWGVYWENIYGSEA